MNVRKNVAKVILYCMSVEIKFSELNCNFKYYYYITFTLNVFYRAILAAI